ncbi:hypothetical protein IQ244_24440 [Nostoc sp. LEGE 06077]|uniref:hypothetical protein n=1 Tax=Nostoc sp. LEGE 06077 TaxID=915325 RepID=UPI001880D4F0|nr:hypothetical protein [Nostoc sp. LEGE 06077]MBE9209589.1 hypothetical protein [Nostoc sp. LEGE 06077]
MLCLAVKIRTKLGGINVNGIYFRTPNSSSGRDRFSYSSYQPHCLMDVVVVLENWVEKYDHQINETLY